MPLAWIQTVTPEQLPLPPIWLNSYTKVIDPARWLAGLQAEARFEKGFWRIRTGVLQREIQTLRDLMEGKNSW